ncbi:MAG TPA: hypothetical protein VGI12_22615 [Vicinamibacterales bacterium]|jgi:hypothetical protein
MLSKLRALVGALIVCLVVVPAFVRATRTFDPGPRPRLAPSFNKSFDVPPDVAAPPPDAAASPLLRPVGPAPQLPRLPIPIEPQHVIASLRGPPAVVRS